MFTTEIHSLYYATVIIMSTIFTLCMYIYTHTYCSYKTWTSVYKFSFFHTKYFRFCNTFPLTVIWWGRCVHVWVSDNLHSTTLTLLPVGIFFIKTKQIKLNSTQSHDLFQKSFKCVKINRKEGSILHASLFLKPQLSYIPLALVKLTLP